MSNAKRNAEARAEALRVAGEELGIDTASADDEALDLLLDCGADHLRDWNIPVPENWLGGASAS
ncbi:hypothetical protein [Burkholderia pseudomultivorans]|uniref:Antitoxin n=1 Tax=Burkholderia pseudomultivorans TaxID=1207504 RepID=A0ABU2E1V2_9BURK|nr:hypothetical protein [Burkholderia pseudomultivorans]HEP6275816.1 hypothetical protein [Burkholderia vietnamiensis]MDR8728331.1 hypothetical protein [Burkholderia pseudomultivorans]MDR8735299.1 hypothetical protein [Burkholderia pseudomultivorans]MDR8741325.1 hypothetical protein [Burkholderia pseudomultivorans]MDR8753721.1 hypothetical protein [Burkholderia pseudomultivorans]